MDRYINPPEYIERERQKIAAAVEEEKKFPVKPARDVLKFLLEHAPLETWQQDVLALATGVKILAKGLRISALP